MKHHLLALSALTCCVQAAQAQVTTWTRIAAEWQGFSVVGTRTVRFGSASSWVTKTMSGAGECTSSFFGRDPLVGVVKQCQVSSVTPAPVPAPPPPAPAPSPSPSPCVCPPAPSPAPAPAPAPAGSAVLSWTPPATVGTGYRVYYGTASGVYSQTADVVGGGSTTFTVTGLTSGRAWYFAVKTVDTRNTPSESSFSNEVSKVP